MDDMENTYESKENELNREPTANPLLIMIDWCKKYTVYIFIFSILIICGIYSYITEDGHPHNSSTSKKHVRFSEKNEYKYI